MENRELSTAAARNHTPHSIDLQPSLRTFELLDLRRFCFPIPDSRFSVPGFIA